MTNSEYEAISPIFTTVAGQGKLMTTQLRQLESRGLNAAAVLAESMGTTEAAVRDMVTKGQIDFNTFAEAMDEHSAIKIILKPMTFYLIKRIRI